MQTNRKSIYAFLKSVLLSLRASKKRGNLAAEYRDRRVTIVPRDDDKIRNFSKNDFKERYTITLESDARGHFSPFLLTLKKGHITCLVGESGCGKTTLLRLLCGLDACQSVQNFKASDVSYMSQLPNLLPWLTVIDNLCLAQKLNKMPDQTHEAMALLKRVGLAHIADHYPNTLSVGMQQRICLLRTCLQKKPIVLLDEPFSALDHDTRIDLQAMMVDLLADRAVLLVTHDWLDVMRLAECVYGIKGWPAILSQMQVKLPTTPVPRKIDFDDLFLNEGDTGGNGDTSCE